jgi:hypothetical protein
MYHGLIAAQTLTKADAAVLIAAVLLVAAMICALPWLCQWFIRSLIHSWRNTPSGGSVFSPLQELVQPQVRHVVEVQQQRIAEDDSGTD